MAEPEYEYIEERNLAGTVIVSRAVCLHANKAPVQISTGETVAYLCLDCDKSFQKPERR